MSGRTVLDQARRLDSVERRWLADARDRLRRTRAVRAVRPVVPGRTGGAR